VTSDPVQPPRPTATEPDASPSPTGTAGTAGSGSGPVVGAKPTSSEGAGGGKPAAPRSPRQIRAAQRLLSREARKILARHQTRLAAPVVEELRACVEEMDRLATRGDWPACEASAERVDELLHQHASFARKSALREVIENVLIAVGVALALRTCVYEPFKIPSGSMMPTLRAGDHIFVNKFVYGIQIPFSTTVIGEDLLSGIRRGDVVVFRYPLDPREDFIKRVIGLPGDVIRVDGRDVWIQRGGVGEFELVPRVPLDERCLDEAGSAEIERCELFRETLDGHEYTVRYLLDVEAPRTRTLVVPPRQLLVMGDNRNMSHDSLQWVTEVEAVAADRLLTVKDLRDLTKETQFTVTRPSEFQSNEDPSRDEVRFLAEYRSPSSDLELEVVRPGLADPGAVLEALASRVGANETATIAELVERGFELSGPLLERTLASGADVVELREGVDDVARTAVVRVREPEGVVFVLRCGLDDCKSTAQLAERVTRVVDALVADEHADASTLLAGKRTVRYTQHWRARSDVADRLYAERRGRPSANPDRGQGTSAEITLLVARNGEPSPAFLRDAWLAEARRAGTPLSRLTAPGFDADGDDAWGGSFAVPGETDPSRGFRVVVTDPRVERAFVLDCSTDACPDLAAAAALASKIRERLPEASADRRKLRELLRDEDVPGFIRDAGAGGGAVRFDRHPWDRVAMDATARGGAFTVDVSAARVTTDGADAASSLDAALQAHASTMPERTATDVLGMPAYVTPDGRQFAIAVEASQSVIGLHCGVGLCPEPADARRMAERIADKARDASTFIDPRAPRPTPFVPRGYVKGRADRIWLPWSRFWLPIE
jgi:signal peptidase I